MKKSLGIKSEIGKTESKIKELETQLTEQTAILETTQDAFINGASTVSELQAENAKTSLLTQTIESLRAVYQRLKSAFEKQFEADSRGELLERMKATAVEVEPLVNSYLDTRNEFNEIVADYAKKLIHKSQTYQNKQAEYQAIVRELKPTGAEIQSLGLEQKTLTMAAATYFNHPALEYDQVIKTAEMHLAAKLNRIAQKKRQSNYNSMKTAA
jgi:uncharacterized coiled-coil protein SlyX